MPGFYETIIRGKAKGQLLAAWIIDGEGAGTKALFDRQEPVFRDEAFPAELADMIRTTDCHQAGLLEINGSQVFLERISDGKRLVICGAGHVALCVIRIGVMLGYEITVIEDRSEFAEKAGEAGAHQVICKPFGEALDEIGGDPMTAFVIMTREHSYDVECLRRILQRPSAYIGMMGSRSRTEQIRQQMLEEGYDPRKVEQIHMPIGLKIGSRTPEEIAVSVAAELISVLNAADPSEGFPPGMAEELAEDPSGILAMIVEKSGEAPRRPGTKMLVRTDGSFLGTVGGGYAEAEILKTARQMTAEGDRKSRVVRITMKKGTMHCGGEIAVFLTAV
ncbi:MAG: XdhC family protein [Clostridia bacterium]|nr:XdhC family protein [Clostridia bacterium]